MSRTFAKSSLYILIVIHGSNINSPFVNGVCYTLIPILFHLLFYPLISVERSHFKKNRCYSIFIRLLRLQTRYGMDIWLKQNTWSIFTSSTYNFRTIRWRTTIDTFLYTSFRIFFYLKSLPFLFSPSERGYVDPNSRLS